MDMAKEGREDRILWTSNEGTAFFRGPGESCTTTALFAVERAKCARAFHGSVPGYAKSPLVDLRALASHLGLGALFVKDESHRFGLNSFKSLGASYALARCIARLLSIDDPLSFEDLIDAEISGRAGRITFATATDGNHGRGVAHFARRFGHSCVVLMPRGAAAARVEAIRSEGAEVIVTEENYDETVRITAELAASEGWTVVQDTAHEGYEDVPCDIMLGYTTSADEAACEIESIDGLPPTHVFLQAGVGAFPAAAAAYFRERYGKRAPKIIVVESNEADCFYRSAAARDGRPRVAPGDLDTMMAGLACGEPSTIAFDILLETASAFVSCPDRTSAKGMRVLASPLPGDAAITSGESGAVTAGLLTLLTEDGELSALRIALGLTSRSRVLLFSTEGATDPENYRRVVWDGLFPSPHLATKRGLQS